MENKKKYQNPFANAFKGGKEMFADIYNCELAQQSRYELETKKIGKINHYSGMAVGYTAMAPFALIAATGEFVHSNIENVKTFMGK
jgi:hypothetical protein